MKITGTVLRNSFSQFLGFRFSLNKSKILIFDLKKEKKVLVDMFYVFFPLDIIFLDEGKKVIEIRHAQPFSFVIPKNKVRYIVEGQLENINLNDVMEF
ncbi:MAG: DUF192 domain-containing protein [Candidatus Nanoarchaeia archaeon]|nr:DUF192 domain-containing protein [Candidatus Nanoarchaeia archaeon]